MSIICFGDSWTDGWGVNNSWPKVLSSNLGLLVDNFGQSGTSNYDIYDNIINTDLNKYETIIVGWSGSSRRRVNGLFFEFSCVSEAKNPADYDMIDKKRSEYFKNMTLYELKSDWTHYIEKLNNFANLNNKKIIHFTVFGDLPNTKFNNFVEMSFLEYLANDQNQFFKFNIPVFEYDFINNINFKNSSVSSC